MATRFDRRIIAFLLCGGIAAGVNWSSRFLWSLALSFGAAVVAAYATGMVAAFLLFRRFVFPNAGRPMQEQVASFVAVNLIGVLVTLATAQFLVRSLFPTIGLSAAIPAYAEALAHAIAVLAPVITSWIGHRYLTFR